MTVCLAMFVVLWAHCLVVCTHIFCLFCFDYCSAHIRHLFSYIFPVGHPSVASLLVVLYKCPSLVYNGTYQLFFFVFGFRSCQPESIREPGIQTINPIRSPTSWFSLPLASSVFKRKLYFTKCQKLMLTNYCIAVLPCITVKCLDGLDFDLCQKW